MNPQATPEQPAVPNPNVLPPTGTPEQVAPAAPEVMAGAPTAAPAPAVPVFSVPAAPSAPPPQPLTADEVAAALAASPVTPPKVPMPDAAADQDVIEPEWVDKAEDVVAQTAGNPYAEEEAVENLQIDYLAKRYGHSVKKADQADEAKAA